MPPLEYRRQNFKELLGTGDEEAEGLVKMEDEAEAYTYQRYTGFLPSQLATKNILTNTAVFSPRESAKMIAEMIKNSLKTDCE